MKKVFLLFGMILLVITLVGAEFRREKVSQPEPVTPEKKECNGYTIIEFGKGINCDGDTVKLVKVPGGGQQLATAE